MFARHLVRTCKTPDDSAATVGENENQSGPYFTDFSLHIPELRVEIAKICPLSRTVSLSNT
jgi:hypothetical protein